MLQRSCREIDERQDYFVTPRFFCHAEIFSAPGNIWRAPYSPHLSPHSRFFLVCERVMESRDMTVTGKWLSMMYIAHSSMPRIHTCTYTYTTVHIV